MSNAITVNTAELNDLYRELKRMEKSLPREEITKIQSRHARPIVNEMKSSSPYKRFQQGRVIGITASRSKGAPPIGIRLGVIRNGSKQWFPDFTAPALASVLNYGTPERFRKLSKGGFVTGHQSTGKVKGRKWLRPAWDRNVRSFMERVERAYIKKVER